MENEGGPLKFLSNLPLLFDLRQLKDIAVVSVGCLHATAISKGEVEGKEKVMQKAETVSLSLSLFSRCFVLSLSASIACTSQRLCWLYEHCELLRTDLLGAWKRTESSETVTK